MNVGLGCSLYQGRFAIMQKNVYDVLIWVQLLDF